MQVTDNIFVTMGEEQIRILAHHPPDNIRFVLGYAGWGGGQLAEEMKQGAWLHAEVDQDLIFGESATLWELSLASMGVLPGNLSISCGVH